LIALAAFASALCGTAPIHIKGHKVAASKANPEFLVKTHEGKRAAHKASALRKE
jgi:hypothetical protein